MTNKLGKLGTSQSQKDTGCLDVRKTKSEEKNHQNEVSLCSVNHSEQHHVRSHIVGSATREQRHER